MKRAAVMICAALLFTGCGSSSHDIAKDYKAYLDYAFDGDVSIEKSSDESSDDIQVWDVSFTDVNGEKQTEELTMYYLDSLEEDEKEREQNWAVLNFVVTQRNKVIADEMYSKIISKCCDCEYVKDSSGKYSGDGFELELSLMNCDLYKPIDEVLTNDVKAGSGMRYSDHDLKSWAADKTNGVRISVFADDSSRVSEFANMLSELGSEYTEYTVSPQNFCFELYVPDNEGNEQLVAAGCRVLGEETDARLFTLDLIADKLGRGTTDELPAEAGIV